MRNVFAALQVWAAMFLTLFGLGLVFANRDAGSLLVGSILGSLGLTFLILTAVNLRRRG